MLIASIGHKALERLWIDNESRGLPADQVKRIRAALALLSAAADMRTLATVPGWRLHELKGNRKGVWSMTINWRLTFRIAGETIHDIDLEDYH